MKKIEIIAENIINDINLKEKDISIIFSADKGDRIRQFVVLNREYKEEDKKIRPVQKEYINSSFFNIMGCDIIKKAYFTKNKIDLEILYKKEDYHIIIDISKIDLEEDTIKYLKFILKDKIELKKEVVTA